LGVQFKDMPSITLNVSASDVSNIKKPSDVQFINTVYQLKPGDQFEVLYTEALYPVTGKKYTYDSASNAPYNQSDNYVPLSALKTAEKPATAAVSEVAKPTKPVVKPELRTELFYSIRETSIATAEKGKFNQLVKFLKENPDVKVSVVGYADAGTGNDEINDRLAQQRAENVAKALQRAGIAAQRITTDSKGSSIQPYPENDKNRVAIIVAK
jgi:outer membrane protein OmpA-like peptidoglycan-associated protein